MAKNPDFHRVGAYYHIVLRASRREALFSTPDDRRALNTAAIRVLRRFGATLHGYCLMPNQFRALVQIDHRLLPKALKQIATRYSRFRVPHTNASRHLFERPYVAQRIETDADFLNILRSVHSMPVAANKVVAASDYRWSSHRAYLGFKSVAWLCTEHALSLLGPTQAEARIAYQRFMSEGGGHNPSDAAVSVPVPLNRAAHNFRSDLDAASSLSTSKLKALLATRFWRRSQNGSRRFFSIY